MKKPLILAVLAGLLPAAALAHGTGDHPDLHVNPNLEDCSIQFAPELTQEAFHRFVREFGSVSAFKQMAPPVPLGRGRVAVALQNISFTVDEYSEAWNNTFAHPNAGHPLGADKSFPMLRARVGLTDALDLGGFYTENARANYGWVGVEALYGLLRQDESTPVSVAVRGAYTRTIRADDLDLHAASLDVSLGRTFRGAITPYVGVGSDALLAHERSVAVDLDREMMDVPHRFAGAQLRLGHLALGAEVSRGALTSWQLQVASLF
jgi:hypothetical protein